MLVRYGAAGKAVCWWMQNGAATCEDSLAVSYKVNHMLTIQSRYCPPRYSMKGGENLCPYKNLQLYKLLSSVSSVANQIRL